MIGTKWYKCDLHLHTPASKCFKDRDTVTAEQWVQTALDKGLHCVAVTDHNTAEWVEKIQEEGEKKGLIVFPGVELTCSDSKVHLLVLFERATTKRQIEDFITLCRIDYEMFGTQEAHSPLSVEKVFEEIKNKKAICIPAHIDEYSGLCEIAPNIREALFKGEAFLGVQIVHPDLAVDEKQYKKPEAITGVNRFRGVSDADIALGKLKINEDNIRKWRGPVTQAHTHKKAVLTFSDNPHAQHDSRHGLWGIGSRSTWIKMDQKPGLESLRQALLLQQFRIKNDFGGNEPPYKEPDTWIKGIKVKETELSKLGEELTIQFSSQMNTVIGGRGSGKSSILQFLRGVFQKENDKAFASLPALRTEFSNFFKLKDAKNQGVLRAACCIEIVINRRGELFKVSFNQLSPKDQSRKIYKWDPQNSKYDPLSDLSYLEILDFEIYSQKQIYEMANNLNSLRERIDTTDIIAQQHEVLQAKRADYVQQSAHIRALKQWVAKKEILKAEIQDIETKIKKVQEAGIEQDLKRLQEFDQEDSMLRRVVASISNGLSEFDTLINVVQTIAIRTEKFSPASANLLQAETDNFNTAVANTVSEVEATKSKYSALGDNLNKILTDSEWQRSKEKTGRMFAAKRQELIAQGVAKIDEVEADIRLLGSKKQDLTELEAIEKEIAELVTALAAEKANFIQEREKLTKLRKQFLNEVLVDGKVRAKVIAFKDFDYLEGRIRETAGSWDAFHNDIDTLKQYWSGNDPKRANVGVYGQILSIHDRTYRGADYDRRFLKKIEVLNGEQLDSFDLMFPEDVIQLEYYTNAKVWKPLSNASAGQKTAAILTLILAEGNKPLLLDQPEDDLDNYLIYDLVVDQLRKSKESRQIITVTHNANIPVNGDSEVLIVMDSETKHLNPKLIGTIEEEEIKKAVCSIMEGGTDAFNMRSKRYQNVDTNA